MKIRILPWLLTLALAVLLSDNILWCLGFPVANVSDDTDPYCLWEPPTGAHQSNEDPNVWENVGLDGTRRSHHQMISPRPYRVLCLGCSYTFGVGVADEDTYVWRLNELMPSVEFVNGGVGGYGPLACLVREKRLLEKGSFDLVMYGLIGEHHRRSAIPQTRNVEGSGRYRHCPARSVYTLPITAVQEELRFVDLWPRRYDVPGASFSPLLNFIGGYYTAFRVRCQHRPSWQEQQLILCDILDRQCQLAAGYGCPYLLVSLQDRPNQALLSPQVHYFDNTLPGGIRNADRVGGLRHNHPGRNVHRYWAERLAVYLSQPEVFTKLIAYPRPTHRRHPSGSR